ncbi:MAG TPA: cupredoxin domain-containing protein [Ilumatobacteraceae bacterium]|nr:cupredoxin domain-containing protein [Ilumatobacteraceae bacterium]
MGTAATKDRAPDTRNYPSRRQLRYQERKNRARNRVIAIVSAVLLLAVGGIVVVMSSGGSDTAPTTAPFNGTTLNVVLGDYVIQGDLTAPAGNVRLQAINQGGIVHNVGIRRGPISGDMQPGRGFTLDVGSLAPGTYQLYCDIPDHIAKGMVANLVIT